MGLTSIAIIFFCAIQLAIGSDVVPVLFWSPERAMSGLPDVSSTDVVQPETFTGHYLRPIMEKTSHSAVLFLQDKLHMDDFTKYADVYSVDSTGGSFKNIKNLMEENFSLELPQVSQASKAVNQLMQTYKGVVHSVSSLEELSALDLSSKTPFLMLVHLPSTASNIDQEAAIAKSDKMIGAVCKHLTKRGVKYSALFTGKASSQGMVEEGEVHSGRHLLADEPVSNNGTLINITVPGGSPIFLYMRTISVCVMEDAKPGDKCSLNFNLLPKDASHDKTQPGNGTAEIVLNFASQKANNGSSDPFDISIMMNVKDEKDRWTVTAMQLSVEPKTNAGVNGTDIKNGNLTNVALDLKVPILYSFHCTELYLFLDTPVKDKNKGSYVKITGFQFQPFHVQGDRFFNSVDCVGFFTGGIWMGLFPVLLLLSILLGGTMMLLNLSIMDKYDDPKGKTITVHAQGGD